MKEPLSKCWVEQFYGLARLKDEDKKRLIGNSVIIDIPSDTTVFGPDNSPENMLFMLDGTLRVQQLSDAGREIVLYRIRAGESCVLTTACLLGFDHYSAEGISETPIKAAAVPRQIFDDMVAQSKSFRDFVFTAFSKRITDLFITIEELAFQKLDVRLAHKLLELSDHNDEVSTTHQKLSVELGTAREVISRQLQDFHKKGWIEQSRGAIKILSRTNLISLAQSHT